MVLPWREEIFVRGTGRTNRAGTKNAKSGGKSTSRFCAPHVLEISGTAAAKNKKSGEQTEQNFAHLRETHICARRPKPPSHKPPRKRRESPVFRPWRLLKS